jgi:hypothetical protein
MPLQLAAASDVALQIASATIALLAVLFTTSTLAQRLTRAGGKTSIRMGGFSVDLDQAEKEIRERVDQDLEEAHTEDPREREFALMREYHAQGLAQSRLSFRLSLVFASLGFVVILLAVANSFANHYEPFSQATNLVSLTAGSVTEAVSALFFVQSNRARALMVGFFDRLRADRNLREAQELAREVPDTALSARLLVLLALSLAEAKLDDRALDFVGDSSAEPSTGVRDGLATSGSSTPLVEQPSASDSPPGTA